MLIIPGVHVEQAQNNYTGLEVFFNAINFTNVPYKRYSNYPNKGETDVYTRYSGSRFQMGLRLTL